MFAAFCGEDFQSYCNEDSELQPLEETPSEDALAFFYYLAKWSLHLALPFGGVFAFMRGGKIVGAAITYPPNNSRLHEGVPKDNGRLLRLCGLPPWTAEQGKRLKMLTEAMKPHHLATQHWYIQMLGVSPLSQGQGIGKRVVRFLQQLADANKVDMYLETHGKRNEALYSNLGFQVHVRAQVQYSPTFANDFVCMVRHPQQCTD